MNETIINVPKGIKYLSEWDEFDLENYPYILDKQIPGCGFTEWSIMNKQKPIVLCSPRKVLLQNKKDQHQFEVHLVINELEKDIEVDKDLENNNIKSNKRIEESPTVVNEGVRRKTVSKMKNEIKDYLTRCIIGRMTPKILVTYDSFRHVKDVLQEEGCLNDFYIVVDEFQSIFTDSSFKSTTELEFVDQLRDIKKVCYASATPMIKDYLDQLDDFKNLPYHKLDWGAEDGFRLKRPDLKIRSFNSVNILAESIINTYLQGNFEVASVKREDGTIDRIESKEAVFYVNSVKNITGIINRCGLTPDQVNILCANTDDNRKKVKKLGKGFDIGTVPIKGEPNKMFTFCTRTVYLGADFYSTCARSFIISDANMKTLKVDIDLDLPQILGRQRLDENPWKNRAEFYYKSVNDYKKKSLEEFKKEIKDKENSTSDLLSAYDTAKDNSVRLTLAKYYKQTAKAFNYKNDYVAVNEHKGKMPVPVENELVKYSEIRAFQIQQLDYADRFTIINRVNSISPEFNSEKFKNFFDNYKKLTKVADKLKLIVNSDFIEKELDYVLGQVELTISNYIIELGIDGIKACGYNVHDMNKETGIKRFDIDPIKVKVQTRLKEGDKISLIKVKSILENIYKEENYDKSPKASDLENYFEVKTCKFVEVQEDGTKKSVNGYKLVKKL